MVRLIGKTRVEGKEETKYSYNNYSYYDDYYPIKGEISFEKLKSVREVYDYFKPEHYIVIQDSFITNVDLESVNKAHDFTTCKGSFLIIPKYEYLQKEKQGVGYFDLYNEENICTAIDIIYRLIKYKESCKHAKFSKYRSNMDSKEIKKYKEIRNKEIELLEYALTMLEKGKLLFLVEGLIEYLLSIDQQYMDIVNYYTIPIDDFEESSENTLIDEELFKFTPEELDSINNFVENNTDEIYEE